VDVSPAAEAQLDAEEQQPHQRVDSNQSSSTVHSESKAAPEADASDGASASDSPTGTLSEEQQAVVDELKATDREVRAHEQAHLAAAGVHAKGGPTYSYEQGPDGQQYAVGGEVAIDTAPVSGDPEATIRKAQIVRAAASAPAEPSSQDRAVAVAATQLEIQATQELRQQEVEATDDDSVGRPSSYGQRLKAENQLPEYDEAIASGQLLDLIG